MRVGCWLTNKTHWLDFHVREVTAAWSVLTQVFWGCVLERECNTGAYMLYIKEANICLFLYAIGLVCFDPAVFGCVCSCVCVIKDGLP